MNKYYLENKSGRLFVRYDNNDKVIVISPTGYPEAKSFETYKDAETYLAIMKSSFDKLKTFKVKIVVGVTSVADMMKKSAAEGFNWDWQRKNMMNYLWSKPFMGVHIHRGNDDLIDSMAMALHSVKRPPLGLTPKFTYDNSLEDLKSERIEEIEAAIDRYFDVDKEIPDAWIKELIELILCKEKRQRLLGVYVEKTDCGCIQVIAHATDHKRYEAVFNERTVGKCMSLALKNL